MSDAIHRREDTDPDRGTQEYGAVEFADKVNKKYPIDTPEHVRAAWSYIHHRDNAAKYNADEVTLIKEHIRSAAKKHGITISEQE